MTQEKFSIKKNKGDLVFGLVAPVGIDLELVKTKVEDFLKQFNYHSEILHLSKLSEFYTNIVAAQEEYGRISQGMTYGTKLREDNKRKDFFALLTINKIKELREKKALDVPTAFIVRSFKRPEEIETMREVYGNGFYLLGITASEKTREQYLADERGVKPAEKVKELIVKDYSEETEYGQRTRDTFQLSDFFIDIDDSNWTKQLTRVIDLIFGHPLKTPSTDEHAMFLAYMSALRSGDLSRQVGAVITNRNNDIVSTGANDVPKFGGGQYWPDENDQRDLVLGEDSNAKIRDEIVLNIVKEISSEEFAGLDSDRDLIEKGKELLKGTGILDLTEYGRAVHAEMEALLSAGRNGIKLRGSTLYTTTFPCHNCAKHIVVAGVSRVKFIEPYPKSYAKELHGDAIYLNNQLDDNEEPKNKVIFEPFVGIGPRRYIDLFSMTLGCGNKKKRKNKDGNSVEWERAGMSPVFSLTQNTHLDYEEQCCVFFDSLSLNQGDSSENETKICPNCKNPMVQREAKKGKSKGKKFWGCSDYPKCKKTISMQ